MALQDTTLEEAELSNGVEQRLERYKGVEGNVDRIALVLFRTDASGNPDPKKPRILKGSIRYHDRLGSVVVDPDIAPELWATFSEPREKATTAIVRYPTDASGRVLRERIQSETRLCQWEFATPVLSALKEIDDTLRRAGRSIGMVDLKAKCKSSQYQRFDLEVAEPCIWRASPTYAAGLLGRLSALEGQLRIGRELTEAELRAALGMRVAQVAAAGGDDDIERLLNEV